MTDIVLKDSYFDGYDYYGCKVKTSLVREGYDEYKPVKLSQPGQVYRIFQKLSDSDRERMYAIYLDSGHQIIGVDLVCQGTLNYCPAHPREIFKSALLCSAAFIIILHSHPVGDPKPSKADKFFTDQIISAGEMMGIYILDHVIIGADSFFSFNRERLVEGQRDCIYRKLGMPPNSGNPLA